MKYLIIPEFEKLEETIEISKKYDVVWEYNDFYNPDVYDNPEELEKRIEKYMSIDRDRSNDTLHGVFLGLDIAAVDNELRERSRKLHSQSLDIASRLGVKGVVFHTGLIGNLKIDYYLDNWLSQSVSFWKEQCKKYPKLTVYMENSFETEPSIFVELMKQMEGVDNFKLCFDYAHAMLTPTSIDKWCASFSPYIGHMHLNDNDLKNDLHLVPGEGCIDYTKWKKQLNNYNIDSPVLIEVNGIDNIKKSLEYMLSEDFEEKKGDKKHHYLQKVLDIGIALSVEKNPNHLLNYIIETAMDITNCDGGTLYLVNEDELVFKIMKTKSKGVSKGADGERIDLPPVAIRNENICGYATLKKESLNIEDVYDSDLFDFSGPKKYDAINEYRTKSMVVIPMINHEEEVIGAIQLLNAMDDLGNIRAFSVEEEEILLSLASQTAIALSNMQHMEEIHTMIWSFTQALTEAIDARTPYNASHTRNVAKYAGIIAERINELHKEGKEELFFDKDHMEQLRLSAFLHDIGKMVVPIEVMNKQTRLGELFSEIMMRFDNLLLKIEIAHLKGELSEEQFIEQTNHVEKVRELVQKADAAGFLQDELMSQLEDVFECKYKDIPYFSDEEKECLKTRKGTLTAAERVIMESHVEMTERILDKVHFNKKFMNAPVWAAQHHECIDGSGYPNQLKGDEIGPEARILAVADICDALLATDRPYKQPLPKEKAFAILYSMADEGKIEGKYVTYLKDVIG